MDIPSTSLRTLNFVQTFLQGFNRVLESRSFSQEYWGLVLYPCASLASVLLLNMNSSKYRINYLRIKKIAIYIKKNHMTPFISIYVFDIYKYFLQYSIYPNITMQHKNSNNNSIEKVQISLNLEQLSPKQLLCQCIDLASEFFKELITYFCQSNNIQSPLKNQKSDFSFLINYLLDPNRLQQVLQQFIGMQEKGKRALVKSWLFQLRQLRNNWAHNQEITYRLCNRGFDTFSLIYDSFKGNKQSQVYRKLQFYRQKLIIITAKKYAKQHNNIGA